MTRGRRVLLCILAGAMLGLSFPPFQLGPLATVGLVPLLLVLDDLKTRSLRWIYSAMVVFHVVILNWTGGYAHMKDPYMMIAGAITMTVHPFFYFLPLGLFVFVKRRLGASQALLALPFLWVAYEYSHTLSEWSFPWLTVGNSQSYDVSRIQYIEYTGVLGISFWIVVMNVSVYFLLTRLANGGKLRERRNLGVLLLIVAVYVAPTVHGRIRLDGRNDIESSSSRSPKSITVGMVQANVDPWDKWTHAGFETLQMYFTMTDSLLRLHAADKPDMVLWPETAMPYYILAQNNQATLKLVRGKIDALGVPILFGLPQAVYYEDTTQAPPSAKRIAVTGERYDAFNATAFIQPGVREIPWYGKMKMVPIAERVPYADAFYVFDFLRWGVGIGGWQIGRDTVVYQEKRTGAKFCSMICYESVYPEFVASFVRKGAEFISIVTIDSWWDRMSGAYQHHQFAVFRAIENRRWIARCAVGGMSSYIDPRGNVHDKTELFTKAVLSRTLERRTDLTFFTRCGDWVGKLCSIVAGAFVIFSLTRKRKET